MVRCSTLSVPAHVHLDAVPPLEGLQDGRQVLFGDRGVEGERALLLRRRGDLLQAVGALVAIEGVLCGGGKGERQRDRGNGERFHGLHRRALLQWL